MADEQLSVRNPADATTPEVTAEGEETIQPDVSGAGEERGTSPDVEEIWYDANKVPPQLQPTYREMQAGMTKKIESEVVPWRKIQETYGGPDELESFLSQLTTQEGLEAFFVELGSKLGYFNEDEESQYPVETDETDPSTEGQFDPRQHIEGMFAEYIDKLESQQAEQAEDQELASTLDDLKVPTEAKHYVLSSALKQPTHLGVAERIKRGYQQWQKDLESYAKTLTAKTAENDATTPTPMGGGMPGGGQEAPKTWEDAKRNAAEKFRTMRADA